MRAGAGVFPAMQNALNHLRAADPVMARLIDELGPFDMEFLEPNYESLARAIIYQQLSGKVASVMFARLARACGNGCMTPEAVLKLRPDRMRRLGLSKQKTAYIREIARLVRDRKLDLDPLKELADDEVHRVLTGVKGIGPWTVHMYLMFALRRMDVLPVADLGIQAAIRKAYGMETRPTTAEVAELGRKWSPYCTVACWYLWKSLEGKAGF